MLAQGEAALADDQNMAALRKLVREMIACRMDAGALSESSGPPRFDPERPPIPYADIFQHAPTGYLVLDSGGVIEDVNTAGAACFDLPRETLIRKKFLSLILPADAYSVETLLRETVATGERGRCHARLVRGDGSTFRGKLESAVIGAEKNDERPGRILCGLWETTGTEHQGDIPFCHGEHSVRSDEWYRLAHEHAPLMMHFMDREGRFAEVNQKWLDSMGYAREEMLGRPAAEFMTSESAERMLTEVLPRFRAEERVADVEYRYIRRGGAPMDVLLDCIRTTGPAGNPIVLSIVRDITEQKRAVGSVFHSDRRFRDMLENVRLIAIMLDTEGRVTFCNDFTLEVTGWKREEVQGRDWFSMFLPDTVRDEVRGIFRTMVLGGHFPAHYENPIITRSGEKLSISWSNTVLRDERGTIVGITSIGEDITERTRAVEGFRWELEVNRSIAELSDALLSASMPIDRIADIVLEQSRKITGSEHGFVSVIDPLTHDNLSCTLTSMMETCRLTPENRTIRFPVNPDGSYPGLWGHSLNTRQGLFDNDPQSHPVWKGTPDGHVPIRNFLAVPAMMGDELLGLVALCNSPGGYTERELAAVQRFAGLYSLAIHRRRAEDALIQAETEKAAILNGLRDVILKYVDSEMRIIWTNAAMRDSFGKGSESLRGVPCYELVHGRSEPCPDCTAIKSVQTGEFQEGEVSTPDGRIWMTRSNPIRNAAGAVAGVVHMAMNITDRIRAEEEVRHNETRLQSMVRILQYRSDSVREFLDHALSEAISITGSRIGYIYHYSEERREFVLNTWSAEVMRECAVAETQTVYRLDSTGIWGEAVRQRRPIIVNDFQAPHELKRGYPEGHVPLTRFLTVPVFNGDEIVAVVGVANKESDYGQTDVLHLTILMESVWRVLERKRAEVALRESEERFRMLFNSGNDAVFVHPIAEDGIPGRFIEVNEIACRKLGYTREELLRMTPADVDAPDMMEQAYEATRSLMKNRYVLFEMQHVTKSNHRIPVEINSHVFEFRGVQTILSIVRDISVRKDLQNKIDRLRRESEAFMRHEFKNLLIPMKGYAELLLFVEGESLNDKQREYLEIIQESSDRAVRVVDDLKKLQDIESGTYALSCLPVSLRTIIINTIRDVLPTAESGGVIVRFDPCPGDLTVTADPTLAPGVFSNLIMNAVEHVSDHPDPEQRVVTVHAFEDTDKVVVRINNRGAPVPPERLATFFDKFNSDRRRKKNGTGLGTTYAYLITRAHGGDVFVTSDEREGTTVTVVFPAM